MHKLLLETGTLLLLRFRHWPFLVVASLAGTSLLYCGWYSEFYSDGQCWLAFGIVFLFFLFYNLYILVSRLYSRYEETTVDQIVVFASAALFFLAFFAQHHWLCDWPVKSFTLLLAAVEIGLAEIVRRRAYDATTTISAYAALQ